MASDSKATIGLALAGGGPLGAVYELGALSALAEALEGVDFNALDVYVGVSAGGFIAAGLANGVPPRKLAAMFVESETSDEPLSPSMLLKPAFREYARRAASVPPLLLNSIWHYISNPLSANFFESFQRLSRAIPTGVFNNAGIDEYLTRLFSAPGRTNDFRDLRHKLFLVATDLDTGESVSFGAPGFDHVPISSAVQASAALPGLFPPVEIENRYYVDGALKKTLHASVALDYGAKLLLCVNPLVPFDSQLAARRGLPRDRKLIEGGLPVVLAQTFRAIIHSRMQVGMSKYDSQYRGADVVLFEPNRDDADMFFTNMFSYSSRRRLSEHAYQKTRAELLRRYDELRPVLERHGVSIRLDVLRDPTRRLLGVSRRSRRPASQAMDATRELASTLADLETALDKRLRRIKRAA
ncbi:MAG: patatin-like phospholipase family protein [Sterolibacteriaceae bacterium]|jgi:predicted acylesterase/phospholipase RssA|nr:patatin-like phospholipase family protein [Sterolibacteriaceae bacterium]MBK9085168.1 patatin-like phospholipase family protein [Sterolibacteriaceae bacterium]